MILKYHLYGRHLEIKWFVIIVSFKVIVTKYKAVEMEMRQSDEVVFISNMSIKEHDSPSFYRGDPYLE